MSIEAQLNIEVRSKVLKYSLILERLINDLLLLNLRIYYEKNKTRLFSNKGKLTFQNKIDLLFDIEVLSKEENSEFELLMTIRNKFMHDIECDSFQTLLYQLDKGIVNRFKKFLGEGKSISDEEDCKKACYSLFQKNIDTIKRKNSENKKAIERKYKLFQVQNEQIIYYTDFISDLLNKISITTENSEVENLKGAILGEKILKILEESVLKLNRDTHKDIYEEFFNADENLKMVFGVNGGLKDLPKWNEFKIKE